MDVFEILDFPLGIILFFWSDANLPRNTVVSMIDLFKKFVVEISLRELCTEVLESLKHPNPVLKINQCFDQYGSIFEYVDSEKKIPTRLRAKVYIEHKLMPVDSPLIEKIVDNITLLTRYNIF